MNSTSVPLEEIHGFSCSSVDCGIVVFAFLSCRFNTARFLERHLIERLVVKLLQNYINGRFAKGVREFADINPADGSVIARVTEADQTMVDEAVSAARRALEGEWGRLTVPARATFLNKIACGIEARFDEFLQAEVADTGKPVSLASRIDVPRGAANFRIFADIIKTAGGESFRTETQDGVTALNYTQRKPLGVVGVITPWNLPLLLLTWKVAPALACGNCIIAKPSE